MSNEKKWKNTALKKGGVKSYPVVWGLLHKRLNVGIPIKHPLFSDWGLMETLKRLKASPQDESFGWVKLGFRGCLDYGKPFHVRISSWFVHKIYIIQPKHLVSRGKSTYREIHSIRYIPTSIPQVDSVLYLTWWGIAYVHQWTGAGRNDMMPSFREWQKSSKIRTYVRHSAATDQAINKMGPYNRYKWIYWAPINGLTNG